MAPEPSTPESISVLFVCLGNICRSPMAEAVFRHHSASLPPTSRLTFSTIDSAGTGAYHVHSPPDPRTMATLRAHNITNYSHSARKVRAADFTTFDYILAMDEENLEDLLEARARAVGRGGGAREDGEGVAVVRLIGDFREDGSVVEKVGGGEVVGDPYYGGNKGFETVYKQLVRFSEGFLKFLEAKA
ncbi:hypothetical protein FQN55_008213 [Onygenales sp. PD_40]|nr:hypothetical protein FQN55_008213 [Onygenales sp. PD_40]KAK2782559.1 hypothetical protein FQN53_009692 [Emmonsiellopsis sp. PD_33]KAK2797452.1 hypothetical protein FQN51_008485 [Onygenales sp. PD_10]